MKTITLALTEEQIKAILWLDDIIPKHSYNTLNQYGFDCHGARTHYDPEIRAIQSLVNAVLPQLGLQTYSEKVDFTIKNSNMSFTGQSLNYQWNPFKY